jgi:hypothetical protein
VSLKALLYTNVLTLLTCFKSLGLSNSYHIIFCNSTVTLSTVKNNKLHLKDISILNLYICICILDSPQVPCVVGKNADRVSCR